MVRKDKKASPDLSEVSRLGDRRVLEILTGYGDDLSRRRHTLLFFHRHKDDSGTDAAIFDPVLKEASELGFTVAGHHSDALIVEGHKLVDPENLEALSAWAEEVAEAAGVHFDGWECALDEGPEPN
jgi:hypothetical protein